MRQRDGPRLAHAPAARTSRAGSLAATGRLRLDLRGLARNLLRK